MRSFLRFGRRRYALVLLVIAGSLVVMGSECAPTKEPTKEPAPSASLSIEPTERDFATWFIGDTSTAQTFMVTNDGPDTSGPLAVNLVDGDFDNFVVSPGVDNCSGEQLVAGDTCTVNAAFTPIEPVGEKSTNLVVSGDPGGSATAVLSGTAALV